MPASVGTICTKVFNTLRYVVRTGCPWRMLPNDLRLRLRVHQQMQHWFKNTVIDPNQWCPGRLRQRQAKEGLQSPSGRRYAGQPAGAAYHLAFVCLM